MTATDVYLVMPAFMAAKAGGGSVTVNPDTLKTLTYHGVTENAVQDFIQDFEKCCGYGKTMLDF